MNIEEYNCLGQAIDTTWGRSSTVGTPGSASMSVKAHLLGENQIVLTYTCVISFGNVNEREQEMEKYGKESESVLDAALKRIKDDFKELAERTLKTKELSTDEDWELLTLGQFSGRRDAFYRKKAVIEVT
jgi:hypothetical protein